MFLAVVVVSLVVRESAVAKLRSTTGAATVMTRHPITFYVLIRLDILCISDGNAFGGCCCGVDCLSKRSYVRYYRDDMLR